MTSIIAALLAAAFFAVGSVLQHAAASAPGVPDGSTALRLTAHLAGTPRWLLGLLAGGVGLVLHALALHTGQVAVVQPMLATGLVIALLLAAVTGHPPGRGQWASAGGVVIGLGLFLASAQPAAGTARAHGPVLALASIGALLLCALVRLATARPGARHAALLLGVAAGTGFGVVGALLKQVVDTRPSHLALSWPPYALVLLGAISLTLAQAAYQAGDLVECLPALTVLEPLIAVAVGASAFSEALQSSPAARIGQVLGVVVVTGSVIRLVALQARADDRAVILQ